MAKLGAQAVTVIVIVGCGGGLLMAYAIGRFFINQRADGTDLEAAREGEKRQTEYMRDVRTRNRQTLTGTYGQPMSTPAYYNEAAYYDNTPRESGYSTPGSYMQAGGRGGNSGWTSPMKPTGNAAAYEAPVAQGPIDHANYVDDDDDDFNEKKPRK